MEVTNVKLYVICILDALTLGFLMPILSTHVTSLGGTHTTLGTLASFYSACQMISVPLSYSWNDMYGKKFTLFSALFINCFMFVLFACATSYAVVVLIRLICGLTNKTQSLCKSIASELNSKGSADNANTIMNGLTVLGLVIGPIIGGYLFDFENGFTYLSVLGAINLAIGIIVCLTLPSLTIAKNEDATTLIERVQENISSSLVKLKNVEFGVRWKTLVLKFLYTTSTVVFFMKFSMLLKYYFRATSLVVGFTYSYQGALSFLSHFIVGFIKPNYLKNNIKHLLLLFFIIALLSLTSLCFAETYNIYLASFVPMIIMHTSINLALKQLFVDESTKEQNIAGTEDTIANIASIVVPVIFGIFCDWFGHYALKAFVILPILCNVGLIITMCLDQKIPIKVSVKKAD